MTTALLEGRGLVKRFGGVSAVSDVDIVVGPGEMIGVIGPNGSGKTTLFDCLTRLVDIDGGRVLLDGVDITGTPPHRVGRMGLARTFQDIRVYRRLSVLENMTLSRDWGGERFWRWLRPTSTTTVEGAERLLDFLTLSDHLATPAGELSWGQQRLLEIGMALMSGPRILLLDEATSGVNPAVVDVIKDRIRTLNHTEGTAFVVIEHDIDVIADLCDRVIVLDHGEQLASGTVDMVFRDPAVIEAYLGHDRGLGQR